MPPNEDHASRGQAAAGPTLEEAAPAGTVWREDEGVSLRVQRFYAPSERHLAKVRARTDVPSPLTMAEVAKHNTRGDVWVVVDGKAYDVSPYVETHPGGWLPIVNMGGKDCTDAFANYHPARVYKQLLPHYFLGDVVDYEESAFQKGHRALRQQLLAEGAFETRSMYYVGVFTWLAGLWCGAVGLTLGCASFGCHLAGAAMLALFWQQMAFVGHDMGHNAVTHRWKTDNFWGLVVGNLTTGIGMGWWKRSHNVHHVCCNSIEHDPDIQHMPLFAVTPGIFKKFWSSYHAKWVEMDAVARVMVPYQHYLFYPVMALARFNLYVQSWLLLLSSEFVHNKVLEVAGLAAFVAWYGGLVWAMDASTGGAMERLAFVLVSHSLAGVLHVQICLSHFAREVYHGHAYNGDGDEWFRMQVATTLNIDCPWYLDWFHGGLQFQIEHHLWPRLPRHNLRRARDLVKAFCKKHKVEYHELPWIEAQVQLVSCLKDTAMAARQLNKGEAVKVGTRGKDGTTIFEVLDAAMRG